MAPRLPRACISRIFSRVSQGTMPQLAAQFQRSRPLSKWILSMELSAAILGIAVALTLGAISPGPSFIMVARASVAVSRRDGLAAAVGMGIGGVFFSAIALLGLISILTAIRLLHLGRKVFGGT
jgi:hypothetical protein